MKICPKCHEEVEDSFEICWNCNYSFPDDKILDMTPAEESDDSGRSIDCLRCQVRMVYSGKYEFDLYVCPKCGKVEFFVPLDREREFKVE